MSKAVVVLVAGAVGLALGVATAAPARAALTRTRHADILYVDGTNLGLQAEFGIQTIPADENAGTPAMTQALSFELRDCHGDSGSHADLVSDMSHAATVTDGSFTQTGIGDRQQVTATSGGFIATYHPTPRTKRYSLSGTIAANGKTAHLTFTVAGCKARSVTLAEKVTYQYY